MKSGVSLQQMLTEVKRQSESKEDYLIAPNRLRMESYGKEMFLHLSDDSGTELIEPMTITGIAHRQIGTHLRIPAAYYDRMREERPDLLAYNANTWFKQESSQRMLRTLDGSARAYLSNRYRRIDNIDIAGVTLPILGGLPDIRFESCQITESRMYIKAVNPRLQAEVPLCLKLLNIGASVCRIFNFFHYPLWYQNQIVYAEDSIRRITSLAQLVHKCQ